MSSGRSGGRALARELGSLELQRNVQAPALARTAVAELLDQLELGQSTMQTLMLLISEVVTNAVIHSNGPRDAMVAVSAEVSDEVVRVTVTDAGSGFVPRQRDPDSVSDGYGLFLLERASRNWGVESDGHTSVWFELARESPVA